MITSTDHTIEFGDEDPNITAFKSVIEGATRTTHRMPNGFQNLCQMLWQFGKVSKGYSKRDVKGEGQNGTSAHKYF